ncbi:MAG: ABC transporter substrate-binding protein [Desulfobacteraceae bacterium]|jgi:putative ABC transport system substrate-binding protein|nr:ABC transporter substrate-binding protein [Desulfobacteraceae bacterium]
MNSKFKIAVILILAAGLLSGGPVAAKEITIGVLIANTRPGLEADQNGFAKALKEAGIQATYDRQNAAGDMAAAEAAAEKFVADKVDMIHVVGLEAAQAAAKVVKDIPVVYSSVRDPVGAGIVPSLEAAGGNITGVSNAWPIEQQVEEFHRILPGAKKWGTVYSGDDPYAVQAVERARAAMNSKGLELVEERVSTYDEIKDSAKSMVGKVDAFFIMADQMVAVEFGTISGICDKHKIPLFTGTPAQVTRGAIAGMGIDFYQVGYSAGHKAVMIIKEGKKPGEIASGSSEHLILYISLKNAKRQGVEIPEEFLKKADRVFK